MNANYATHAFSVLLLATLGGMLLWSVGFAVYLNLIHSHGWASTRRLLRTLMVVGPLSLLVCGSLWEDFLVPIMALAKLGHPGSQMEVARRYATGDRLLARDHRMAHAWLKRAARSGLGQAQLVLAGMEWEGIGIPKPDLASALSWAKLAAKQDLMDARLLAGEILLKQPALAQPGEQAQTYFDAALPHLQAKVAAGDGRALFTLGLLKLRGHGVPMDLDGGLRLLLQAEKLGLDPFQSMTMAGLRAKLPAEVIQRAGHPPA